MTLGGIVDRVVYYTYDDDGFVTGYTTSWDETGAYTYDENHLVLNFKQTSPAGTDYEETYTRDVEGRVLSYAERSPGYGLGEQSFEYDDLGRLIRAEGTLAALTYTYDGGNRIPTTGEWTQDTDPLHVHRFRFSLSADLRVLHSDELDAWGDVRYSTDATFDDEGRITDVLLKRGRTHPMTHRQIAYTAYGEIAAQTLWEEGSAGSGSYYDAQFDPDGRLLGSRFFDAYSDGSTGYVDTPRHTCVTPVSPAVGARSRRVRPPRTASRALPYTPGPSWCGWSFSIGCW